MAEAKQSDDKGESVAKKTSSNTKTITKPKKKAVKKRKPTAKKSKRPTSASKTLETVTPPPLTMEELKEQGREAKQEIVSAVIEPAVEVVGSLSQTVRDTISGAFAGLLSRRRRD